jgi:hypothetical protein
MTEARIDGRLTMIIKPMLCNLESMTMLRYG